MKQFNLFSVKNFEILYPNSGKKLIYNVDFSINKNEFILLTGKSGIGKSTFFLLLKGILGKIYNCKITGEIFYNDNGIIDNKINDTNINSNVANNILKDYKINDDHIACNNRRINDIKEDIENIKEKIKLINIIEEYPQILEKKIGYLGQNPYTQIVNNIVLDELVFGMENFNFSKNRINENIVKFSGIFGLDSKLEEKTRTLSGGLCQRLNLASIIAYEPDIILLDEPVSFLDQRSSSSFYEILRNLKGKKTILIIEHQFEDILPIVDKVIYFEGEDEDLIYKDKIFTKISSKNHNIARVFQNKEETISTYSFNITEDLKSSRHIGSNIDGNKEKKNDKDEKNKKINLNIIEIKNNKIKLNNSEIKNNRKIDNNIIKKINFAGKGIFFKYEYVKDNIFENLSFDFNEGKIIGIIGENGSGKTTFLQIISGILRPQNGEIELIINKKKESKLYNFISILFQNSESLFFFPLVKDEINHQIKKTKDIPELFYLVDKEFFDLSKYWEMSGFTLSEGEKRRLAFMIQILMNKPIRLYDEPTYAQDYIKIQIMKKIFLKLKEENILQIVVSHDKNFLASISDEVYIIKDKKLIKYKF